MRSRRFGGLDGLRAIAVALVLGYHLFPSALPGGFLGVDIFFAISGFLITSLLLREHRRSGTINLLHFWRRRARRLLPALALVLLVSSSLAALVRGDLLVGIGKQIAGAVFFVSNWVYIAIGSDYFTRDNPEIFRNTWSLAIEEQFYLVLPLLVLVLFRASGRVTRALPFLLLGTLSAAMMIDASAGGDAATRIYFGSDTHVFGLFLGAALAVILSGRAGGGDAQPVTASGLAASRLAPALRELGLGLVAAAGLGVLGWQALTLREGSAESFEGGFQLATGAALATIWAITREGAIVGRWLDADPLRWVGERSYGIYLWHWPLLVIFGEAFGPGSPLTVAATFVATILAAAASYRFLEQPVRRLGLRGAARRLLRGGPRTTRNLAVSLGLAGVLALTVPGTVYAVVTAPEQSTAASAIARGQAVADAEAEAETAADGDAAESGADHGADPGGRTAQQNEPAADPQSFFAGPLNALESLEPSAPPEPRGGDATAGEAGAGPGERPQLQDRDRSKPAGDTEKRPGALSPRAEGPEISAIGDSVMLASLPELQDAFPGIAVDAAVSRGMGAGVDVVSEQAETQALRRIVVVGLGTNGPVSPEELDALAKRVGNRPLVLVDAHAERDWIPGVNRELAAFADARRGVVVARWDASVAPHEDALAGDGIHPNPPGGEIYAKSVERAIAELDTPAESIGFALPRR
ncbi:acetyltransferase [Leucobacter sp. CSA2]|uniref:Acetyltransferase n=1 Tax=Leucobacter edaphi TaxID=2796472 RepID=A0A934UWN0_9MICO|nr:acyltransferase family protein [Leucobacter edaphi]MBK0420696.1 acetyltransferase [Leucobacter edaphi]